MKEQDWSGRRSGRPGGYVGQGGRNGLEDCEAQARGLRSILSEMGNLKGLYKAVEEPDLHVCRSLWLLGNCEGQAPRQGRQEGLHSPGWQVCMVGRSSWILTSQSGATDWMRVAGRGQG